MEIDLSEFEICYFIMLSPKLLNSFEKSSGLLEIYLEHFQMCLSLKFQLFFPLLHAAVFAVEYIKMHFPLLSIYYYYYHICLCYTAH